jgi:hypothetical protein
MEAERCPNCGDSKCFPVVARTSEGGYVTFAPMGTSAFPGVSLASSLCCLTCGHVWARLDPDQVRSAIGVHGSKLAKQYLKLIVDGPYHDLPEDPAAREAADRVFEIDGFMILFKDRDATRRYRDLTGKTWDQAIADIKRWHQLDRAEKLALLGWCPKEKTEAKEDEALAHPMRDRWLDG